MIAYIRGILSQLGNDFIIVEAAGLGYQIFVAASTLQRLPALGQEVKVFTYHCVREDAMTLYGFINTEEQAVFMHLISISGIGPKGALTMLGALDPGRFVQAVAMGDVDALTKIPGVGKKTAQRLVLELKDKINILLGSSVHEVVHQSMETASSSQGEAYEALLALGYTVQEAGHALTEVRRNLPAETASDTLVRQALRVLMTREGK